MNNRSVGIIFAFEDSVLLQRRGEWNWSKNAQESFRGLYQVSAHGGCESSEDWMTALKQEVKEELGAHLAQSLNRRRDTELVLDHETANRWVRTYGVLRPLKWSQVQRIRLEPGSGGLVPFPIAKIDQLKAVSKDQRDDPLEPGHMFEDEILALRAYRDRLVAR